jgi:hypothetical protein
VTVTVLPWPNDAHIVELRYGIDTPSDGGRSGLTRRASYGPMAAEQWSGEILLASVSVAASEVLAAALHDADGKVAALALPLASGFASHVGSIAGTLAAATTRQADRVSLNLAAGPTIEAGMLMAIGALTDDAYQVVEVLQDFTPGAAVTVFVSPRIRTVIASGTAVALGAVTARVRLSSDDVGQTRNFDHSDVVLPVMEFI